MVPPPIAYCRHHTQHQDSEQVHHVAHPSQSFASGKGDGADKIECVEEVYGMDDNGMFGLRQ